MKYKIIQWATGPVGRSSLQHIINNPDYELVGLYAHSPEKVGLDAGSLVGMPDTGITATNDIDAIVAMDADVVVYTPMMPMTLDDIDPIVIPLLESGKSIVTPAGYWWPPLHGQQYVDKLESACKKGNASIFGAGEDPGFFTSRLAPTVTAGCSEVHSIVVEEMIDCRYHPSPVMIFDTLCMGKTPEEAAQSLTPKMLDRCTTEDLSCMAHDLGLEIDSFEKKSSFGVLDYDIELPIGPIKAGTVVVQNHQWKAMKDGRPVLTFSPTWFVHTDVPGWDLDNHWVIKVEGRPCFTIDCRASTSFDESPADAYQDTNSGPMDTITAMTCVNAIPDVCSAKPGIVYPRFFGLAHPKMCFR
jgi:hypothetical protein